MQNSGGTDLFQKLNRIADRNARLPENAFQGAGREIFNVLEQQPSGGILWIYRGWTEVVCGGLI